MPFSSFPNTDEPSLETETTMKSTRRGDRHSALQSALPEISEQTGLGPDGRLKTENQEQFPIFVVQHNRHEHPVKQTIESFSTGIYRY